MILNLCCQTKSNKFNFYYFKQSNISLKIKGTGNYNILGNEIDNNFTDINSIKEVNINGIKQNIVARRYDFNQTDNFVEHFLTI